MVHRTTSPPTYDTREKLRDYDADLFRAVVNEIMAYEGKVDWRHNRTHRDLPGVAAPASPSAQQR